MRAPDWTVRTSHGIAAILFAATVTMGWRAVDLLRHGWDATNDYPTIFIAALVSSYITQIPNWEHTRRRLGELHDRRHGP